MKVPPSVYKTLSDGSVVGLMPSGESKIFENLDSYEGELWDQFFDDMNQYYIELPECV